MDLRKAKDNSMYQARLGDRRIRVYAERDGVRVRIKRTVKGGPFVPKTAKTDKHGTITFGTVFAQIDHKRTTELVFELSDEAGEALCALLTNWYGDHISGKEKKNEPAT